jgi:hypothetical protein
VSIVTHKTLMTYQLPVHSVMSDANHPASQLGQACTAANTAHMTAQHGSPACCPMPFTDNFGAARAKCTAISLTRCDGACLRAATTCAACNIQRSHAITTSHYRTAWAHTGLAEGQALAPSANTLTDACCIMTCGRLLPPLERFKTFAVQTLCALPHFSVASQTRSVPQSHCLPTLSICLSCLVQTQVPLKPELAVLHSGSSLTKHTYSARVLQNPSH